MDVLRELGIENENLGASVGLQWQSHGSQLLPSINPANNKEIALVKTANVSDYSTIVDQAKTAFSKWRIVPAPMRGECIRLIAEQLRLKKDWLGTLVSLESGKIKSEGDGEVQEMIDMADFAVGQSRMLYGKTMQSERLRHQMIEQWHPLGPIGLITAFNFPVAVWAWNAFIGAVCGNPIIWKPSHKVPLSAIAVQKICNQVMQKQGFDGIFSLFISDEVSLAERMVADNNLPLISFTGSTAVGRKVAVTVGQRLGRHILELSGNNAVIIDETADLRLAIPSIVFGAVGTAGQRCTSTRRVIIHQSRYEEFVKLLLAAYQQVKIGDPLDKETLMGPLIDQLAVADFERAIKEIHAISGEVLYGGKVLNRPGNFVEPTIVRLHKQEAIAKKETFAPILYLFTYQNLPEAIALQNEVAQGLSSALFTENLTNAEYFISALGSDCGIANVNIGTSGAEIGGAFGGEKDTGGGREAGSDAWKSYMRRQTTTINWSNELPLAQGINFNLPPI